jgi:predicted MFS family arabinose efflux permease
MLRILTLMTVAVMAAAPIGDSLVEAVTWVLAFFALLMLGDLLWSQATRLLRRPSRR